ncbi:aminopyrimidine aminohydrolase [Prolixibacter bellariivorans]|uniref:Aminopyrimidine aminohydrolase n=1 Tax=Prolixibacter bellariivorans TaxID=314319 RepID=A0A5M4B5P4_9BACT|nr:TenA family protein [Prolixibacter bellariivorans]GET35211.1 aminopyrimidine aminohydrolase [Prolixibacter bellariivorans]
MKWNEQAWKASEDVYAAILKLPFLHELMNGTLPKEKFFFYLQQDALYLAEYGKILAGIAARLDRKEWREAFLHFSSDTVAVEQALHQLYLNGTTNRTEPTPSCQLYTGFMYRQLTGASIEEVVASVLPCFLVYKKVGDYIQANQTAGDNPYQSWIDTYGGEDFALAVEQALSIGDELAVRSTEERREGMTRAFIKGCQLEWMFWDSAWRKEAWPV